MDNLPYEIGETANVLRRSFDRRAATLGVTGAQWKVLLHLTRKPGLRQVELAELLDVEPITLSRIIDRLEQAGLVERASDPADRRAWRLQVTAQARPLIEKLRALAEQLKAEAFADLTNGELGAVSATLTKIRENLCAAKALKKVANQ
jgi:MarR family transcriptional regulator, transcriptional regulator for hemolysin